MKKYILVLLVVLTIILIIPKEDHELRIRVIANSNSDADQKLKYEVVELLKNEIKKFDAKKLDQEIKNNLDKLDDLISKKIKEDYSISYKKIYFPPKESNGNIIKGGKYKTLLVVIGKGEGKNWWSILNPSCSTYFEDENSENVVFKFYFYEKLKKVLK